MPISVDETCRPIFIVRGTGDVSDDEYVKFLEQCKRSWLGTTAAYSILFSVYRMKGFSSKQRQLQAEWVSENRSRIALQNKGIAFVLDSAIQRGVLAAIHLLSPPPYPHKIFTAVTPAYDWCESQLAKAGISAPKRTGVIT